MVNITPRSLYSWERNPVFIEKEAGGFSGAGLDEESGIH
jgi:hypothetical protein